MATLEKEIWVNQLMENFYPVFEVCKGLFRLGGL